jgi:hypothetical protein
MGFKKTIFCIGEIASNTVFPSDIGNGNRGTPIEFSNLSEAQEFKEKFKGKEILIGNKLTILRITTEEVQGASPSSLSPLEQAALKDAKKRLSGTCLCYGKCKCDGDCNCPDCKI